MIVMTYNQIKPIESHLASTRLRTTEGNEFLMSFETVEDLKLFPKFVTVKQIHKIKKVI